jgi:hypothetical protein
MTELNFTQILDYANLLYANCNSIFYYFPIIFITVKLRYKIQEMSTFVILGYKIKIWHGQQIS